MKTTFEVHYPVSGKRCRGEVVAKKAFNRKARTVGAKVAKKPSPEDRSDSSNELLTRSYRLSIGMYFDG